MVRHGKSPAARRTGRCYYIPDIPEENKSNFWFDIFNERYPDEVKEILDNLYDK